MIRAALREAIYAGEVSFSRPPRFGRGGHDITNWRFRAGKVQPLPGQLAREILARAESDDAREDYAAGSALVERLTDPLIEGCIHKAFDEELIRDYAENYSRLCGKMHTLEARALFAGDMKVRPPERGRLITREGAIQRLDDSLWWRRQLRRSWTRRAEGGMRDIGIGRKGREPYASDLTVRHRAAQKRRWRAFMERSVLTNLDTGEQLPLLEVAEKSLANPRLRRGEFMCRVRGFEEISQDLGHVAEFVTLTCPSAFHAYLSAGGRNPAFTGATPKEAQGWMCRMWARARAKLKRLSILFYGFRIAEPHHDATPHWHCLFFVPAHHVDTLRGVLRMVWLSEYAGEAGAGAHRVKFETIEPGKGSAVGYIAKYVSKNIDGAGAIGDAEDTETGGPVAQGVARVDAWASVHGIRQFQQIGGPPVGLWREARRLRQPAVDPDIERARLCADRGDWRAFVANVGGISAGRRTNVRLETCETGALNRYGEPRPASVIGIRCASAVEISRPHRWRIERAGPGGSSTNPRVGTCAVPRSISGSALSVFSHLGPVAITVRSEPEPGYEWIATVPYIPRSKWTNPRETSQAGP